MAVFMELELQVTPDQYDAVDAALDPKGNPPDGLIAHSARFERVTGGHHPQLTVADASTASRACRDPT